MTGDLFVQGMHEHLTSEWALQSRCCCNWVGRVTKLWTYFSETFLQLASSLITWSSSALFACSASLASLSSCSFSKVDEILALAPAPSGIRDRLGKEGRGQWNAQWSDREEVQNMNRLMTRTKTKEARNSEGKSELKRTRIRGETKKANRATREEHEWTDERRARGQIREK